MKSQGVRVLVILGKAEREKFEVARDNFTQHTNDFYNNTRQYHDGKWLYIDVQPDIVEDVKKLILIKRNLISSRDIHFCLMDDDEDL